MLEAKKYGHKVHKDGVKINAQLQFTMGRSMPVNNVKF